MWLSQSFRLIFICSFSVVLLAGCGKSSKEEEFNAAVGKGDTYRQAGLYKDALSHYEKALALAPDNGALHLYIATCNESLGLVREALKSYDQAIRHDPSLIEAYRKKGLLLLQEGETEEMRKFVRSLEGKEGLGSLYPYMRGQLARAESNWEEAIKYYKQALGLEPESGETAKALAIVYRQAGRLEEAVEALRKIYEKNPTSFQIAGPLAQLYEEQGNDFKAIEILARIAEAEPRNTQALSSLSLLYLKAENGEQAGATAAKTLAVNPDDPMALYVSGSLALERGEFEQALTDLESAIAQRPGDERVRRALREAKVAAGEIVDRVKLLEQRITDQGESPGLLLQLADAHLYQGNPEEALPNLQKVLEQDANSQPALLMEALCYLSMGQVEAASRAVRLVPDQSDVKAQALLALVDRDQAELEKAVGTLMSASATEAWGGYFRGLGLLSAGNFEGGLKQLDDVVREYQQFGTPLYEMARLYQQINEPHLSFVIYQRLIDLFPDSPKPILHSAQALLRMGQNEAAKARTEDLLEMKPDYKPAKFFLGSLYLGERDFQGAAELFDWLAKSATDHPVARAFYQSVLAKTYVFDQQYETALGKYQEIIAADPNLSAPYIEKCLAEMSLRRGNDALATCDAGLASATDRNVLNVVRAVVLQQLGKHDEALEAMTKEMDGESWEVGERKRLVPLYASIQTSARQYDTARETVRQSGYEPTLVEYFLESIDLCEKGDSDLSGFSLALLFSFYQWPDAAISIYEDLVKDFPDDKLLIAFLGESQGSANRDEDAYETYNKGVEQAPKDIHFLERRALWGAKINRHESAMQDYNECIGIEPKNPTLRFHLARLYDSQGLNDVAIDEYRMVEKLNPL